MSNSLIWVIDFSADIDSTLVTLEIFSGRNKYTKKGLFSGPLRKITVDTSLSDCQVQFLLNLDGIAQIGKCKFKLTKSAATTFLRECHMRQIQTMYCRMQDRKLHHVDYFRLQPTIEEKSGISYEASSRTLLYSNLDPAAAQPPVLLKVEPTAELYLSAEEKVIRGYLIFLYDGVEVPANSNQEIVHTSTVKIFRNLQFEQEIQKTLYCVGAEKSLRNEVTFPKKSFLEKTLPMLYETQLKLFWGHKRKEIVKANISCSISYDIDWFSISGAVYSENYTYRLSDLLKQSRGKSYIELDSKVFFIPKELQSLSDCPLDGESLQIDKRHLSEINRIAERFQIDPSSYLQKFLNFSEISYTLPPELDSTLKSYQKTGVKWIVSLYQNGFGGCLADDMGLGKTVQTIAFIACQERCRIQPVLVVVPKILLYNWKNEIYRFLPSETTVLAYGDFDFSAMQEADMVYLTTYDTLVNHSASFCQIQFDAVILDEAQYVKNSKTNRYKAVKQLNAKFLLALTGTPIENNVGELWSLMSLLNPGLLGSYAAFIKRFGQEAAQSADMDRLRKIISPFILRRTKEEVLSELPPKQEYYVYCEMEESQRILYEKILLAAKNEISQRTSRYVIKDNSVILQALLYLREACSDPQLLPPQMRSDTPQGSCKFELFKDYAVRIIRESGKLIVYSQFPRTLKRLEAWCKKEGWETFFIDGSVNNRQEIIERFEAADRGVFLISLKAGGIGLNLVSCQYSIIYDPWWNTAAEQQAADRIYRIGQQKTVFIYHFLVKDTIEQKVYELQTKKLKLASDLLSGLNPLKNFSLDEVYNLLFD